MQKVSRFIGIVLFACCTILNARMLVVPVDFPTIQSGIESAETGDTVLVNPGRYAESINFSGKKITVASHYLLSNDSQHIKETIIFDPDPEGKCSTPPSLKDPKVPTPPRRPLRSILSRRANTVTFNSTEDKTSILTGFTILDLAVIVSGQSKPAIRNVRICGSDPLCNHSTMSVETKKPLDVTHISFLNSSLYLSTQDQQSSIRHTTFENSYINTRSLKFIIDSNTFITSTFSPYPRSNNPDTSEIINNHFENSSISLGGTGNTHSGVLIKHNTITGQASSIRCSGTGSIVGNVLIDSNLFKDNGIDLGGTGNAIINAVITNNTFHKVTEGLSEIRCTIEGGNCYSLTTISGIICHGTGNCVVNARIDYNRFYGANLLIGGTGEFLTTADAAKNIFTRCSGSAIDFNHVSLANCAVKLINNTIVGNKIGINYDNIGGLNIVNCIIWGNGTDLVNVNAEQIRYSLYGTGLEHGGQGNLFGDPKLTDIANLDFRLMEGSPCIGAGVYTSRDMYLNIPLDMNTKPFFNTKPDMGAIPFDQTATKLSEIERDGRKSAIATLQGSTLLISSHQQEQNNVMIYNLNGTLLAKRNTGGHSQRINLNTLLSSPGSYVIRVIRGSDSEILRYSRR